MGRAHLVSILLATIAVAAVECRRLPDLQHWLGFKTAETKGENEGDVWALLIAGSAGFGNYRHQADVAHAYQVLHHGGIPDERIVVMVYDDIANNPDNPRPGTIINHPQGPDVYAGMPKDYTGEQVNAENFLAVLSGNQSAVAKNGGSTGRVIAAGPDDRIFVFYSDHGAPGILGMPSGNFLYADQLHRAIKHRAKTHGFKEMVMYIEACESGSMFEGVLEDDLNVYATTAANGQESSWGCYCPGMDSPPPPEYFTCLGDLYSVSWLEDTDANDMTQESLKQQFQRVRMRTSQNFTFIQGSHVERFGELEMDEEPAATYLGELNTGGFQPGGGVNAGLGKQPFVPMGAVPQREADLMPLIVKASRLEGTEEGAAAAKELEAERSLRRAIDGSVHGTLKLLTQRSNALGMASIANGRDIPLADALMTEPVAAPVGSALVSDWDCLRAMVDQWQAACGPLGQYGMKNSRAFANLCNLGVAPEAMAAAARETCPSMGLLPAAGTVA